MQSFTKKVCEIWNVYVWALKKYEYFFLYFYTRKKNVDSLIETRRNKTEYHTTSNLKSFSQCTCMSSIIFYLRVVIKKSSSISSNSIYAFLSRYTSWKTLTSESQEEKIIFLLGIEEKMLSSIFREKILFNEKFCTRHNTLIH